MPTNNDPTHFRMTKTEQYTCTLLFYMDSRLWDARLLRIGTCQVFGIVVHNGNHEDGHWKSAVVDEYVKRVWGWISEEEWG